MQSTGARQLVFGLRILAGRKDGSLPRHYRKRRAIRRASLDNEDECRIVVASVSLGVPDMIEER